MVFAASSYPFLNIFWTMLLFFAWLIWIWTAVTVLLDTFHRHDLSGWAKAAWTIFVIVLPFLGVLTYLVVNSTGMAERRQAAMELAQSTFKHTNSASEIETAKRLRDEGTLTAEEYEAIKARALA